jgi:hypothetical protein
MATYSKAILNGAPFSGGVLNVTATSGVQEVHSNIEGVSALDEVWLYASNNSGADVLLTVYMNGSSLPQVVFRGVIEAYAGNVLVLAGILLQGIVSDTSIINTNAGTSGAINLFGYVNKIR